MYVTDARKAVPTSSRSATRCVTRKDSEFQKLVFLRAQRQTGWHQDLPLSEVATKDDFFNIKKVSAKIC